MPKEVVTLSFGSYASFVSAHYWNLQDEAAGYCSCQGWSEYATCVDHDILFAETEARNGVSTYRPRAVLFDIVGSSGGVSFGEDAVALPPAAAAASVSVSTWHGGCEVHRAAPVARSPFLERLGEQEELDWDTMGDEEAARQQAELAAAARQLDPGGTAVVTGDGVAGGPARHWTDFCKVLFSRRSVYSLPGSWTSPYEHSLAAGWGAAADILGAGGGAGGGSLLLEDAVDRVRHLGEACDSLAGFQVLVDDLTGFGALAAEVLGEVVEEYRGRPRVLFSLRRPGQGEQDHQQQQQQQQGAGAGAPSTGWSMACARDDLSQALALTHAADLASLYVPLAAPLTSAALPHLSYSAALPYHSAAILACAVDTALLPTRLTGVRSPLGEALGATDLHSLVGLLRPSGGGGGGGGGRAANLAALHLALPCPSLPADVQQLQRQLDERVRPPHASQAGVAAEATAAAAAAAAAPLGEPPRGQALYGSTAQLSLHSDLASLTPGISGRDAVADGGGGRGSSWAESYCLRGGRTDAGPAPTASALAALDVLLLRQSHRMCVRHRCTVPMPLAVPLPFPQLFRSTVSQHGDVLAAAALAPTFPGTRPAAAAPPLGDEGRGSLAAPTATAVAAAVAAAAHRLAARVAGEAVHSVPVLTCMQATREFEGWVRRVRQRWTRAVVGAAGRAVLDAWGVGRDDAAEVDSHLEDIAASLVDDDEA